jgi:hypothetical protein
MLSSRRVARFVVAVLLATAIPPAIARAEEDPGTFIDDDQSRFEPYIETARAEGLVTGCNPPANDRFCPHRPVTRGEMAVMLVRALDLPATPDDHFADDDGNPSEKAINALAEAGATQGCGEGEFCPDRLLTRGEMSSLIVRAMNLSPPPDIQPYVDIDETPYAESLESLARRGAIEPCNPPLDNRLCPDQTVTRDEAVFSLTSALDLGPARANTSRGTAPSLGFADAFEALALWDGREPSARNRVSLTDGGYRGTGLRVTIPKGSHYGADFKLDLRKIVGEEPEQLFFRYYLRLDPDWAPKVSGKLPGFSGVYGHTGKGGYQSTPSEPGWSARMEFFRTREGDGRARLGYYVYHLGQEGRYGDGMAWNEAGKLNPGQWYCIEGQVALNRPGLADGALRAWVDGTPAFDVAGIEFRRPEEPKIRIESFWFNVYYGGKPRAERDLGMVIDEVVVDSNRIGCGAGNGLSRPVTGDVNGDGFDDRLTWGECAGGTCFATGLTTTTGSQVESKLGDGAWFSLDTNRVGTTSGDLNGDGREDLVYPGRCGKSVPCWRVHLSDGATVGAGRDWGDGARFASSTDTLISGDWNGDGYDDLVYHGLCGSPAKECWRAHISSQGRLEAADWGPFPELAAEADPRSTDIDGDGRSDLIYPGPCQAGTCWIGQLSTGSSFTGPVNLGIAGAAELASGEFFDFDGDGDDDLISVSGENGAYVVKARRSGLDGLGDATTLMTLMRPVTDFSFRRVDSWGPVEALITTVCGEPPCVAQRLALGGKLVPVASYRAATAPIPLRTLGSPL